MPLLPRCLSLTLKLLTLPSLPLPSKPYPHLSRSSAAAMAVSSLSFIFPSLSPKTVRAAVAKLSPVSLSPSLVLSFSVKPLSISSSRLSFSAPSQTLSSRFVCNVALSEELEEDDVGQRGFSPDLKLFVGNLPFNVDSAQLAEIFEGAGNVEMVEVIYDKESGRSRGFGFVTMSTAEEVEAAVQQFNGYEIDGRQLRVNSGPPPPKRDGPPPRMGRTGSSFGGSSSGGNRVYVGNLSWGVDDMALETLFSEKGRVVEAKVVYDRETGRSRGFGFVTYSSANEVDSAVESLNGADLDGRSIRVSVAEARPPRRF